MGSSFYSADGQTATTGELPGTNPPWQIPSLWRGEKGPIALGGLQAGGCWQGTGFPVVWSVFEQHWECSGNWGGSRGARQLIKLAENESQWCVALQEAATEWCTVGREECDGEKENCLGWPSSCTSRAPCFPTVGMGVVIDQDLLSGC